jgi:hypothetical protein
MPETCVIIASDKKSTTRKKYTKEKDGTFPCPSFLPHVCNRETVMQKKREEVGKAKRKCSRTPETMQTKPWTPSSKA